MQVARLRSTALHRTAGPALIAVLATAGAASAQPTFTPLETLTPFRTFTPNQTFTPIRTFTPVETFTPFPTSTAPNLRTQTPTRTPTRTATGATTHTVTPAASTTPTVGINPTRTRTRTPFPPSPTPPFVCVGDCNGDRGVLIDELIVVVRIALGSDPLASCAVVDIDRNGVVTIDEVIRAVDSAVSGCR